MDIITFIPMVGSKVGASVAPVTVGSRVGDTDGNVGAPVATDPTTLKLNSV